LLFRKSVKEQGDFGMDANGTNARKISDHELNEALEAHALEDVDGLSIKNQRLASIQEYEEAALARSNPFAAVLGMAGSQMQQISEYLGAAIIAEFESRGGSLEVIRELRPEMGLQIKLIKLAQTDLLFQLAETEPQSNLYRHGSKGKGISSNLASTKHVKLPKRWNTGS
jgi:hypothetical protein